MVSIDFWSQNLWSWRCFRELWEGDTGVVWRNHWLWSKVCKYS